jgi:hypothetical protein
MKSKIVEQFEESDESIRTRNSREVKIRLKSKEAKG